MHFKNRCAIIQEKQTKKDKYEVYELNFEIREQESYETLIEEMLTFQDWTLIEPTPSDNVEYDEF